MTDETMRGWMKIAYMAAAKSPDRSTQNGAIIVLCEDAPYVFRGISSNHFPRGIDPSDDRVHERALKYKMIVHAERGAIYDAAKRGMTTLGQTMVVCWAPCPECAQAIIESGISTLIVHKDRTDTMPERWRSDVELGVKMIQDAGVKLVMLEGPVNSGVKILFDGKEIEV